MVKVERSYQWIPLQQLWNYEPVTFTKSVANARIDLAAMGEATVSLPVTGALPPCRSKPPIPKDGDHL